MSLDLLKERFGHSPKKGKDNKEKINEQLTAKFNSNSMDGLKDFKAQHQWELEEKDRIIENLESESSNLANQVLTLEKEKSTLLEEINNSKWMENTIASKTKKIYENKIKKMNYVDSTDLIPLLIKVSREKQGNKKLNWGEWLEIPENIYLFQINESIARKVFEDTIDLIDRKIGLINQRRTRGGDEPTEYTNNSSITFAGNLTNKDYVSTAFDPNELELYKGFTVSFWVKPDGLGSQKFALGLKHDPSDQYHFSFGVKNASKGFVGIGQNKRQSWDHDMEVGNWYHYVVTYNGDDSVDVGGDKGVQVYINGDPKLGESTTAGWAPDYRTVGQETVFIGARNNDGYGSGWNCSIDDVAIFDEVKDVSSLHDGSFNPIDQTNNSGLVGYWRLNEGSGTRAEDLSGNGNHGTLTTDGSRIPTWTKNGSYE